MIDYLALAVGLSLVALVAIACLRSAPARWRLRVALVALIATTLPWTLLRTMPIPFTEGSTVGDVLSSIAPFGVPDVTSVASIAAAAEWEFPLATLLWAASGFGLAAFMGLALRQRWLHRGWHEIAEDGDYLFEEMPEPVGWDCRIRILPGSANTGTSGFLRPTLWIGEQHVEDERCSVVLLHLLMHMQRRHAFIAAALTFIRCVLWWQPFVWLWTWITRRGMEYDCDEACADLLGHDNYRKALASFLSDAGDEPGLPLIGRPSFNLRRVRTLEKAKVLAVWHRVASVVAICMVPLLVLVSLA